MKSKKGISLIVLIVTIIVIIILAAAVILTLNNNNPIDSSRVAQLVDNRSSINSAVSLYYGKKMAETQGMYDPENIFTAKNNNDEAITGMTSMVGDTNIGNYYTFASDLKDTIDVALPNMSNATWYVDITSGLVYLVYETKASVPSWMYTDANKTTMDTTLDQFVRVKSTEGTSLVKVSDAT